MTRVSPNSIFSPLGCVTSQLASIVVWSRGALAKVLAIAASRAAARSSLPASSAVASSGAHNVEPSVTSIADRTRRRGRSMLPPPFAGWNDHTSPECGAATRPISARGAAISRSSHPQNSPSVPRTPFAHSTDIFPFSSALDTAPHVADSFLAARLCNRVARAGLADSARARREQPRFRLVAIDRGRDVDVQAAGARSAHVGGRVVVVVTVLVVVAGAGRAAAGAAGRAARRRVVRDRRHLHVEGGVPRLPLGQIGRRTGHQHVDPERVPPVGDHRELIHAAPGSRRVVESNPRIARVPDISALEGDPQGCERTCLSPGEGEPGAHRHDAVSQGEERELEVRVREIHATRLVNAGIRPAASRNQVHGKGVGGGERHRSRHRH